MPIKINVFSWHRVRRVIHTEDLRLRITYQGSLYEQILICQTSRIFSVKCVTDRQVVVVEKPNENLLIRVVGLNRNTDCLVVERNSKYKIASIKQQIVVFWVVTAHGLTHGHQRFGRSYHTRLQRKRNVFSSSLGWTLQCGRPQFIFSKRRSSQILCCKINFLWNMRTGIN